MEVLLCLSIQYRIPEYSNIHCMHDSFAVFVFPLCHRYFQSLFQTWDGICLVINMQDRMNCCFASHGLNYDFSGTPAHFYTILVMTIRVTKMSVNCCSYSWVPPFCKGLCGICVNDLSVSSISLTVGTEMLLSFAACIV